MQGRMQCRHGDRFLSADDKLRQQDKPPPPCHPSSVRPFFEYLPEEDHPRLFNAGWCFQATLGIEPRVILRNDHACRLPQDVDYGSQPLAPEHGNGLFSALAALSTALRQQSDYRHQDQAHIASEALQDAPLLHCTLWQEWLVVLREYLHHRKPQDSTREQLIRLFTPWLQRASQPEPHQPGDTALWQAICQGLQHVVKLVQQLSMPVAHATELHSQLQSLAAQAKRMPHFLTNTCDSNTRWPPGPGLLFLAQTALLRGEPFLSGDKSR